MNRSSLTAASAFAIGIAISAMPSVARADREIALGVSYDPRLPTGSMRDAVPDAGLAGLQGKWEYYVFPNRLALGFDVGYHYFQRGHSVTTEQLQSGTGAVTAPFTRYAYFLSVMPSVRWFPLPSSHVARPYLEIAAGATSATAAILASDLSRRSNNGGFVVQPSLGVIWALVSRDTALSQSSASPSLESEPWPSHRSREAMFGITTSAAWSFTTADVLTAKNVSYVGVQVGIYTKL